MQQHSILFYYFVILIMSNTVKYKLEEFADADESILIGIISSVPDYTICWFMNRQLNLNLCRTADVKMELIKKHNRSTGPDLFTAQEDEVNNDHNFSSHHVFKYIDDQDFSDYYLIGNKGTHTFLDPILKRVSYFLEVKGKNAENADKLVFDLNAIEPVEMAYLIGRESIINKLQLLV